MQVLEMDTLSNSTLSTDELPLYNKTEKEKGAKVGKGEICGERAARASKGCIMYSRETRRGEQRHWQGGPM